MGFVPIDLSMAVRAPPVKKPTTALRPRRGKIKAQIFRGVAEIVFSAALRAGDYVGLKKNDDVLAHVASSNATETSGGDFLGLKNYDDVASSNTTKTLGG